MSNRALTAVFQHSASKGSARLMLLAMADEANDQGLLTAYRRSQSWLARKANIDGGTARRAVAQLVELGEVVVLARGDGRDSSDYRLVLPDLAPIEGVHDAPPARADRAARARDSHPQGAQPAPPIIPLVPDAAPSSPVARAEPLTLVAPPEPEADSFDAFWQTYPRKVAKPQARTAWVRYVARQAVPVDVVMAGLARWAAYWTARDEPEFVPHPATWLHQHRWQDDPPVLPRQFVGGRRVGKGAPAPTMPRTVESGEVTDL